MKEEIALQAVRQLIINPRSYQVSGTIVVSYISCVIIVPIWTLSVKT